MGGPVFDAALKRALLIAGFVALLDFAYNLLSGADWRELVASAIIASVPIILARGLGEGYYDNKRAVEGNMNAGDVPMASAKVDVTKV